MDYGQNYWDEYLKRDNTDIGKKLTEARCAIVNRHTTRKPVDIGIGAGAFVNAINGYGFDVNPIAIKWLKDNGRFIDPYSGFVGCLTFWDSLEHIQNPKLLLDRVPVGSFVFVSIPVFSGMEDCLKSKHYKPSEHIWYFTHEGFLTYMGKINFFCLEHTNVESFIGRDGVMTYAFVKK